MFFVTIYYSGGGKLLSTHGEYGRIKIIFDQGGNMPMKLREYESRDCPALAELFYETVHRVNAADYSPAQLGAWAPEQVDLAAWDASFRAHCTLVAEQDGSSGALRTWPRRSPGDRAISTGSMSAGIGRARGWPPPSATPWRSGPGARATGPSAPTPPSPPNPFSSPGATGWSGSSGWSAGGWSSPTSGWKNRCNSRGEKILRCAQDDREGKRPG